MIYSHKQTVTDYSILGYDDFTGRCWGCTTTCKKLGSQELDTGPEASGTTVLKVLGLGSQEEVLYL